MIYIRNIAGGISPITILEFGVSAAEGYGKIRAKLKGKGTPIGSMDLLIARTCRSEGLILVYRDSIMDFFNEWKV